MAKDEYAWLRISMHGLGWVFMAKDKHAWLRMSMDGECTEKMAAPGTHEFFSKNNYRINMDEYG